MPKLSIDIGVNLQDSTNQLGKLNSALISVNNNANNLVSTLKQIGGLNISPKVSAATQSTGGTQFQPKPVPDVFADYKSGAIQATSLTDFLEKKFIDLEAEGAQLKQVLATTQDPNVYNETIQKLKQLKSEAAGVNSALRSQSGSLVNTGRSYTQFSSQGEALRRTQNLANLSLINFGRVAQDLPYGILGIANNINPLVEGLSQLKTQAASSGKTLTQALLGSLTGAGGLSLAFSAVTAALGFASVGLSYWSRNSKKAKEDSNSLAKSQEDLSKELENNYKTINQDAAKELTRVIELKNVIESEAVARKKKIEAIKELKKINPEIFGQLSQEKISVEQLDLAYKNFAETLKSQIKVQRVRARLTQETEKLIDAEGQLAAIYIKVGDRKIKQLFNPDDAKQRAAIIEKYGKQALLLLTEFDKNSYSSFSQNKNKAIEKQSQVVNNLTKEYEGLSNVIEIKPKGEKGDSETEKKLTNAQKYAIALQEIKDDVLKIKENKFLTIEEKNVEILKRYKSGIDELADKYKKEFKLDLSKGISGNVTVILNEINRLQSQVELESIFKKGKDAFNEFNQDFKKLQLKAIVLNISTNQEQLDLVKRTVDSLLERKIELISKGDITRAAILGTLIANIGKNIPKLEFKIANEQIKNLATDFNASLNKINQKEVAFGKLFSRDKANLAFKTIEDLSKIKGNDTGVQFAISVLTAFANRMAAKADIEEPINAIVEDLKKKGFFVPLKPKWNLEDWKKYQQSVEDQFAAIQQIVSGSVDNIASVFEDAFQGKTDVAGRFFVNILQTIGQAAIDFGKKALILTTAFQKLRQLLFSPAGPVAAVGLIAVGAALVAFSKQMAERKGFATGGFVSGGGTSTSDSIPARLSNGEYVINARSVSKYGRGFFDRLNNGVGDRFGKFNHRYAMGGLVSNSKALVNKGGIVSVPALENSGGYVAETVIRGQDLRLVLKRADKSFGNTAGKSNSKALVN